MNNNHNKLPVLSSSPELPYMGRPGGIIEARGYLEGVYTQVYRSIRSQQGDIHQAQPNNVTQEHSDSERDVFAAAKISEARQLLEKIHTQDKFDLAA